MPCSKTQLTHAHKLFATKACPTASHRRYLQSRMSEAPGYASALFIMLALGFGSATHHFEHMHHLECVFALGNASASPSK